MDRNSRVICCSVPEKALQLLSPKKTSIHFLYAFLCGKRCREFNDNDTFWIASTAKTEKEENESSIINFTVPGKIVGTGSER
jgi:hypothetical protein